jgi:hypothetical protein
VLAQLSLSVREDRTSAQVDRSDGNHVCAFVESGDLELLRRASCVSLQGRCTNKKANQ